MTYDQITAIITERRSTYPAQFSGEKVSDSVVRQWMELANWAPNHRLTEPWRFKVFAGHAMEKLVDFHQKLYLDHTPKDQQNPKKLEKFGMVKKNTSHIVAVCYERDAMRRLPEWEEIAATSMAVQNLYLGLSSLGLAGYWSTGNGLDHPETREYLALTADQKHLGWFYLGMHDGSHLPRRMRKSMEYKIDWHQ